MCAKSTGRPIEALLLAAGLLLGLPCFAVDVSLGGCYKAHLNWYYDAQWDGSSSGSADNLLRLELGLHASDALSVQLAYGLSPEIRSASLADLESLYPGAGDEYRAADLPRRLLPAAADVDNIALYHEIDRAVVSLRLALADLYVGRQAVSWGSARVVNPTDVLVPFGMLRPDTEYRPGVDAARLRIPIGGMNELDLGCVAGEDFRLRRSAAFARGRLYVAGTDLTLSAMVFRENLLVGLDAARALGQAGAWLEAALVGPDLVVSSGDAAQERYGAVSVGLDYNFAGGLYGYLEYHFNSAGAADPEGYLDRVLDPAGYPAYAEGNVYLLGRHYLSVGGTYPLTPLLPLSFLLTVNLRDPSAGVSLGLEYNIRENLYVSGGLFAGLGPDPELSGGLPIAYRSEFGAYPTLLYTAVKAYF